MALKAQRLVLMIQFAVDNAPASLAILHFLQIHMSIRHLGSGEKSGMSVWIRTGSSWRAVSTQNYWITCKFESLASKICYILIFFNLIIFFCQNWTHSVHCFIYYIFKKINPSFLQNHNFLFFSISYVSWNVKRFHLLLVV